MLPKVAVNEQNRQKFLREIETVKVLRHPNVVWLGESGCSEGVFFFTLEYCDGGSVRQLMKDRGGPLTIAEAAEIVLQALDGLEYAHSVKLQEVPQPGGRVGPGRGLVHRDVKPANLFLSGSGRTRLVKVGDYGLAKAFDAAGLSGLTRTGTMGGTPVFMPRQQVVDFKYAKPEVDVWSAAASLYHLLTGAFPRDFPPGQDWWWVILQTDAVPIRQRNAAIPKKLADVIDLALRDDPEIPFKSAGEFKRALESVL
jgi:serine/threonine-protein kinase